MDQQEIGDSCIVMEYRTLLPKMDLGRWCSQDTQLESAQLLAYYICSSKYLTPWISELSLQNTSIIGFRQDLS